MTKRLAASSACLLLSLVFCTVRADPPEEIRVGILGERGVVFRDEGSTFEFSEILSAAGDVNGDGLGDILLVVREQVLDPEQVVHLVYGGTDLPEMVSVAALESVSTRFLRSAPGFRSSPFTGVAPAGDVDADGFDDFVMMRRYGAPEGWSDLEVTPGLVYLVHGGPDLPREVDLESPEGTVRVARFTSSKPTTTQLSRVVTAGGDYNGDGTPDLVFGAPWSRPDDPAVTSVVGRAYVLFGESGYEGLVDVEGIINGDLPGFVVEGDAERAVEGDFGRTMGSPGDVNGDGFDDLLVGASGAGSGVAYLVYGGAGLPRFATIDELVENGGAVRFSGAGPVTSLAAPGDLNGDLRDDFVLGIMQALGDVGAIYLVYGAIDLPARIDLDEIVDAGLGAIFEGERLDKTSGLRQQGRAGGALAVLQHAGDDRRDIVIGARAMQDSRGRDSVGKVYILHGDAFPPATRTLEEIETGELPGSVVTSEVSQSLGSGVAPVGDFDGDGTDDLLVGAPVLLPWSWIDEKPSVYLIRGPGSKDSPLRIERASPAQAPLSGRTEITLVGSGFDDETTVTIGSRAATVVRVETSARLVVQAPPGASLGSVDVVARRDGASALLAAAIRYVPAFFPAIDVTALPGSGQGVTVIGEDKGFATSLGLLDFDGDGLADVVASSQLGRAVLVYGREDPPTELHVQDLLRNGTPVEGVAVIVYGGTNASVDPVGDLDADGHADLAIGTLTTITVLLGGERYEGEVTTTDLVSAGRGFEILHQQRLGHERMTRVGGGDHDGDGFDDLLVSLWSRSSPSLLFFIPGRSLWPAELFLVDAATIRSLAEQDAFGAALAFVGDVDGDGDVELLAGAPGGGADDGNVYLFTGPAFRGAGDVAFLPDIEAQGRVRRFTSRKQRDSLGEEVAQLGDFNGDGRSDMAITAKTGGADYAGEVYVIFSAPELLGSPGSGPLSVADLEGKGVRCIGARAYDRAGGRAGDFGHGLAPAGDFNGDGLDDLLIVSNNSENPSTRGNAYVVFGGPARTVDLHTIAGDGVHIAGASRSYLGGSASGGGDFNGDGLDDIVLDGHPASGDTGRRFYIVFGHRFETPAEATFLRGDANASRVVDLSDPVFLLARLFSGGAAPPCEDAADANDDGRLDLTDAVFTLDHLFGGGATLPAPGAETCGADPTEDELNCANACP